MFFLKDVPKWEVDKIAPSFRLFNFVRRRNLKDFMLEDRQVMISYLLLHFTALPPDVHILSPHTETILRYLPPAIPLESREQEIVDMVINTWRAKSI